MEKSVHCRASLVHQVKLIVLSDGNIHAECSDLRSAKDIHSAEDLSQFPQARLLSCRPFGFAVLWFRVVLRDLHKFDVNASNLKRPAKVTASKGKIDLTAAPKRRRVFMIEFGVKRKIHNPKHSKNTSMRW